MMIWQKLVMGTGTVSLVTSLTPVTSAVSNAGAVTTPALAAAGDLAVLFDFSHNAGSGPPADVTPTGYTQIATDTQDAASNDTRMSVSYKVLVGGDPGAVITGLDSTNDHKIMFVFRPNATISTVVTGSWLVDTLPTDPAAQVVSASGQPSPLVVFGASATEPGTAAFSTASPAFDATVATADADMLAGYKIYDSAPANHTIDMADLGNANGLASGYIRVT